MGEFEIPYEFQTHDADFWIELFHSTYEFKIDFELAQILNSATSDRVWAPRHVETSFKGHHPIQNTLYSIKTLKFLSFLGYLWLLLVIRVQWAL